MRKKLLKLKGGKGSASYGIIIPKPLLEFIGCELNELDNTTIDIQLSKNGKKITISDPKTTEE